MVVAGCAYPEGENGEGVVAALAGAGAVAIASFVMLSMFGKQLAKAILPHELPPLQKYILQKSVLCRETVHKRPLSYYQHV